MSDIFCEINLALLHEKTCDKAWGWINNPQCCRWPEHAVAAARCWLAYRFVNGDLDKSTWEEKILPITFNLHNEPHMARWAMSNLVVDAYAFAKCGNLQKVAELADKTPEYWRCWPPALVNFVRLHALSAYASLLLGDADSARAICIRCEYPWEEHQASFWSHNLLDTINSAKAMFATRIILIAAGKSSEKMNDYIHPRQAINHLDRMDFEKSLINLSALFPSKALWLAEYLKP